MEQMPFLPTGYPKELAAWVVCFLENFTFLLSLKESLLWANASPCSTTGRFSPPLWNVYRTTTPSLHTDIYTSLNVTSKRGFSMSHAVNKIFKMQGEST